MDTRPEIHREIATIRNGQDITRGFVGPMLQPRDRVLRVRGAGDLEIYESVLSEPQVESTFQQRRRAVTKCAWRVEPASDRRVDKKAAEFLRQQLERIGWDTRTERMLYGVFYGYAVAEVIYGRDGNMLTFEAIKVRNRRRFRFAEDGGLRLLTPGAMFEGIPAEQPYFWHFATGADNDDEPYGLGLGHWCYWPVLFKRQGVKYWLTFLEKFGAPTPVGKYPAGASAAERARLLEAVAAIQTDAGVILPEGMEITLIEAARSGTADYKVMHDTMDDTIARITLGQTLTSSVSSSGGSRALGDVHHDVRQDLVRADADLINESFNLGPATWLTRLNFPDADPPRVVRDVEEPEDLDSRAERDNKIKSLGFRPSLKYVLETYGGEWTESNATPAVEGGGAAPPANFAEGDATNAVRELGDVTAAALDEQVGQWVGQVRQMIEQAGSLDEVRDRLLSEFASLPLDQFQAVMAQALTGAHLAGRGSVSDEISGQTGSEG